MITSLSHLELCLYRYLQITSRFPIDVKNFTPFLQNYQGDDWKQYTKSIDKTPLQNQPFSYNKQLITSSFNQQNYFDTFIICWPPGFASPIHNHAKNGCCLKVLEGSLVETRYHYPSSKPDRTHNQSPFKLIDTTKLDTNRVSFLSNDIGVHSISNPGVDWAVSLHIYSPQQFVTTYFN